ncbi:hypothetical protein E3N88_16512 [Mikania micrantha]|uniref:Uncharacterized protein n=1 Tax=Mikania micrantha TaxID=192012 RepID=A0A5N6NZ05_9ASTR|nr:hypothetical protein E3N88_16512 [Mikania micrantha]
MNKKIKNLGQLLAFTDNCSRNTIKPRPPERVQRSDDAPQYPLTNLVMEVDNRGSSMSEVVGVLKIYVLEEADKKHAGENQRIQAEQVFIDCNSENNFKIPSNPTSLVGVDQLSNTPIVHIPITKDWGINIQPPNVIIHHWVYETGLATIAWLVAWCNHLLKEATWGASDLHKLPMTN